MAEQMTREISSLDDDPQLTELLRASVQGNVSTCIHMLANDIDPEGLQPAPAAVDYALRLAQRDVPSNSLTRAYYIALEIFLDRCYQEISARALPAEELMAVVRHVGERCYKFVDWITLHVFEAYEAERHRWISAEGNLHASTIHALLGSSEAADEGTFERTTGYLLSQCHVALLVWRSQSNANNSAALNDFVRMVGHHTHVRGEILSTTVDHNTVWAWLPQGDTPAIIDPDSLAQALTVDHATGTRVALGLPGFGVDAFRRSHEQAFAAYSLANGPAMRTRPVVSFGDRGVAVTSFLTADLETTAAWISDVLGSLAVPTEQAETLRLTLGTYLFTAESHVRTAQLLNIHKNTVKYRVTKVFEELQRTSGFRDKLDLAVALRACELLGPPVLRHGSHTASREHH
ncbi:PucR family transcriptional regulator [Rhodococcus sp. NPDC059968]|uniref:PucR family transcriptional regulator n=1 Tax=Rhodococcus sp. NPDC059968 TaxID=3347017 RepID=UPI00366F6121